MSQALRSAVSAMTSNPELRQRVMAATSAQERAQLLADAGIAVPSQQDVQTAFAALLGVSGAGTTTTTTTPNGQKKQNHPNAGGGDDPDITPDDLEGAAAGVAAAACA